MMCGWDVGRAGRAGVIKAPSLEASSLPIGQGSSLPWLHPAQVFRAACFHWRDAQCDDSSIRCRKSPEEGWHIGTLFLSMWHHLLKTDEVALSILKDLSCFLFLTHRLVRACTHKTHDAELELCGSCHTCLVVLYQGRGTFWLFIQKEEKSWCRWERDFSVIKDGF